MQRHQSNVPTGGRQIWITEGTGTVLDIFGLSVRLALVRGLTDRLQGCSQNDHMAMKVKMAMGTQAFARTKIIQYRSSGKDATCTSSESFGVAWP